MPRDGFPDDVPSVRGSRLRSGLYAIALGLGAAAVATIACAGGWLMALSGAPGWPAEAGAVLAGLGLGVLLGGWLSGPAATLRVTLRRLAATLGAAAIATAGAALLPATAAEAVSALDLGPSAGTLLLAVVLLVPPSACAGAALAILLKLAVDERPLARGPALGTMLACCAAGGFGGTLVAEGLTLPRFGASGSVTGAGLAFAALALVFVLAEPREARRRAARRGPRGDARPGPPQAS